MRRGQNHLRLEPDLLRDLFREYTHRGLRHGNRAEHLLRDAEHIHQLVVPILRLCTHELRRCRVRVLVLHDPRQEIVQMIQRAAPLQPLDHLVKKMFHIPAEMPVPSHDAVLKAMNLLDADLPVLNPAQNVTPARCTNINRQII